MYKVLDGDRIRHQVIFKISNLEVAEGLVEVTFQYGRGGRGMMFGSGASGIEELPIFYKIYGKQTQEIGILLDQEPRNLNINFLIAQNLPISFSKQFDKAELNERIKPFHGERVLDESALLANRDEIIIDNEDKGFEIFSPPYKSVLKQMIHGQQNNNNQVEYDRLNFWRPPLQWSLVKNTSFYGNIVHSAYYVRPGNGQKNVIWKANIEQSGFYDIYTYMFNSRGFNRGGRDRGGQQGTNTFGEFNYIIYHDAGSENVTLSATKASEGWNFLGSWYLSAGEAKVMLTDKSNGRVVLADAIKWVKN